ITRFCGREIAPRREPNQRAGKRRLARQIGSFGRRIQSRKIAPHPPSDCALRHPLPACGERDLKRHRRTPSPRKRGEGWGEGLYSPQTSRATSTTRRSLAFSSSIVSALPSTVEEKPHCGLRQSCSSGTYL